MKTPALPVAYEIRLFRGCYRTADSSRPTRDIPRRDMIEESTTVTKRFVFVSEDWIIRTPFPRCNYV